MNSSETEEPASTTFPESSGPIDPACAGEEASLAFTVNMPDLAKPAPARALMRSPLRPTQTPKASSVRCTVPGRWHLLNGTV